MVNWFRTHWSKISGGLMLAMVLGAGVVGVQQHFAKPECCVTNAPCCKTGAPCCKQRGAQPVPNAGAEVIR
jgi:hypothetical protein